MPPHFTAIGETVQNPQFEMEAVDIDFIRLEKAVRNIFFEDNTRETDRRPVATSNAISLNTPAPSDEERSFPLLFTLRPYQISR